jgi:hypothetical protein
MSLTDFRTKVQRLIQDDTGKLGAEEINNFILEALNYFSKDYPRICVVDIAGDGSYQYDLPGDWREGVSWLQRVEYPAGQRVPVYLEPADYILYKSTSGEKLLLVNHTPAVGETLRLTYTTPYTETSLDQVPAALQDGLVLLAAALCCEALSRTYAQTSDSTIDVDVVDYQNKSNIYAQRAKELQKRYNDFMGKQKGPGAAAATHDWDVDYPWGGDRLNHPRRQR